MNPKTDSPKEPSTHLSSRPSRSWYKRRRFVIAALVFLAVIITGALWYFFMQPEQRKTTVDENATYGLIEASKKQGPPNTIEGKISFYMILGDDYRDVGDYKSALDSYLKADKAIVDRSLSKGQSVNLSLADTYLQLGNRNEALKYLRKELNRIREDPVYEEEPDNKEAARLIEKQIKELE